MPSPPNARFGGALGEPIFTAHTIVLRWVEAPLRKVTTTRTFSAAPCFFAKAYLKAPLPAGLIVRVLVFAFVPGASVAEAIAMEPFAALTRITPEPPFCSRSVAHEAFATGGLAADRAVAALTSASGTAMIRMAAAARRSQPFPGETTPPDTVSPRSGVRPPRAWNRAFPGSPLTWPEGPQVVCGAPFRTRMGADSSASTWRGAPGDMGAASPQRRPLEFSGSDQLAQHAPLRPELHERGAEAVLADLR